MEMASSAPLMNGSTTGPIGSKSSNPASRNASLRHPGGGGSVRAAAKKARMRNRGSQTCSSDDEDLHSDDNLRPYEEVKVAQNDKNLAHFGLTPDESAVSPIMSNSSSNAGRVYSYGSDEESEQRVPLNHQHHMPSQQQQQQQQQNQQQHPPHQYHHLHHHLHHPQQDRVVYDPPWDHINFDQQMRSAQQQHQQPQTPQQQQQQQRLAGAPNGPTTTSESDEDNRHAMQRYSQAGTLPMPPPTFPPPPPPPLEDIPHRSPAPVTRQRSFGPSVRGNYAEADFRGGVYPEDFRRMQQPGGPPGPYTGEEKRETPLENPYMVQTALGAAYSMDGQVIYQPTRPPMHRSGSVPSGHTHSMDASDHYVSSGHSDTYPYHCPNVGDGPVIVHSADRQVLAYPQFGVPSNMPPGAGGSYPPSSQNYGYYSSKFSSAGSRMQKKLRQRCTWPCTAVILLLLCVALLACTGYFAARSIDMETKMEKCSTVIPETADNPRTYGVAGGGPNHNIYNPNYSPNRTAPFGPATRTPTQFTPTVLSRKKLENKSIPPDTFWMTKMEQRVPGFIKLNLSVPGDAIVGVYGRRGMPPTHVQFDFFKVIDGSRVNNGRSKRAVQVGNDYFARDTALVEYLKQGDWFFGIFNDRETFATVSLAMEPQAMDLNCHNNCNGNGECRDGHCHCFEGYKGHDCSETVCPLLCNDNGKYLRGQCQCNHGWKGVECKVREHECAVPNCNDRGRCINGQCVCFQGFQGPHCGIVDCLVPNCSDNGQCIHGKCRCFRGFKGDACEVQDKINITELCASRCSGNGLYDMKTGSCECFRHFSGLNCETADGESSEKICRLECAHGKCQSQRCVCDPGWSGPLCDQLECNHRCDLHGKCDNGTCMCTTGWNGKYCTIQGCPGDCSGHGSCRRFSDGWRCDCKKGWRGDACNLAVETSCSDRKDNDNDGMTDCMDPDCCLSPLTGEPLAVCAGSDYCKTSREPSDVLLSVPALSPTVSFLKKVDFLIEDNSLQKDAPKHSFNDSQASVIRGRVLAQDGTPLIGVRVGVVTQPLYGYTMTRKEGYFDILVNGGGSVKLDFSRDPFKHKTASVLVPWNQIISMDTVVMSMSMLAVIDTGGSDCSSLDTTRADHRLRPVVLSTWKHTQLGACPERSTIIPESQVLQESLVVPGTDVHLVYHSSESSGYMSLILIQMTPETIPSTLSRVHLKVSVEGVTLTKMFEADTNLKYTFAWNRENAYKQPVYGIVTARVHVGYQHLSCARIYWESQSTTLNGYDITASHIGGWNLDIHHTYNYQEGILHKGDGTNIYLKEKPKKIITILGNGQRRLDKCNTCNGKARGNSLLSPMALASGLDGSLYVGDYNFIRKLSPGREEIASIMQQRSDTTPYTYYMTVSPVDGRLYITDFMEKKIKRVRTMGPVSDLERNFDLVAGTGVSCTPSEDRCGDGGLAVNAKLSYPKGIAINKDGIIYVADGSNIRKITRDGYITTLIGSQTEITQWEPPACNMAMPANKARLKWPKSLAINPLDDSLHILDDNIVFKLTDDFKLLIVAGRPDHCPKKSGSSLPTGVLTDDDQASSEADQVVLNSAVNIAFGPHGDLYIVESDKNHINRVRVVTSNGRIHHFAGAKSKCNCQSEKCSCYNPDETLAAQALFSDPTSVTVTPDGVVHLSDMGNLRIFSVVSELPSLMDGHYNVVAPETQELYIFNMYGQHRHTVNINTGQYVYNFTYNVFSSYGKLQSITDSANNVIQVDRRGAKAFNIVAPSGQSCQLDMDERDRLQRFKSSVGNVETRFSYTVSNGLLKMKENSWGQTYLYSYDATGRLSDVRQPTGQVTSLTTDINTSGSIVRMATGSRHVSAMATYGSVQSVLHGPTATNVTYLPDGAVVVQFPSNLTITIESGNHPVMDKENHMHYKRKVIVPGLGVHRLEWRFYLRRGPSLQSPGKKVINRIGNRVRVGSLAPQHVVHGSLGGEGREKALMINGNNLLTVEYDRRKHTETVRDKSQRDIITVWYNSEGLPVKFKPFSSHHELNITYNNHGDIVQWQYGNLKEKRTYKDPGLVKSIEGDRPGGTMHRFFYRDSDYPTDVFLHSGKQYKIVLDEHGNLARIMTPFLGYHHFNMLLSLGIQRFFYRPPGLHHFYIEDYDAMGKLLRVIYPTEQRRVVYRYNELGQRSLTMFDHTLIDFTYHPGVGLISEAALKSNGYYSTLKFTYLSSLISEISMTFPRDAALVGARITLSYDNNLRQKNTVVMLSNNIGSNSSLKYSEYTGKIVEIGGIKINRLTAFRHNLSRKTMVATRLYNDYGRLTDVKINFNRRTHFSMRINYDKSGRVHVWRHAIADKAEDVNNLQNDLISTEYIYDVDSHLKVVLVKSEIKWQFNYDADGNINKIASGGKTSHIKFDLGDKVTMMGGIQYKFDDDGFMAQRGLDHVTFNSAGQLVSVTRHTEFKFNYFYDPLGRLVAQRDRYGRILQFFYSNTKKKDQITHVYNHTTGHLTEYLRDEASALIGMERAGHFYHIVCDPSHSPLAVFGEDGTLKKKMSYTPLGVRDTDSNPDFDLAFGFQGGFYNPTTRLVHFHQRVYDAMLGRFLSPDYAQVLPKLEKVLLEPQTLNLYSHRYLVNLHLQNEPFPRIDLADWLNVLGFDIRSLAPDVSYTGELNPAPLSPDMQLLPAASAFECTFRRDMHNLLTISTVPQSKVTPPQKNRLLKKAPAPLASLFGPGVSISDNKGTAIVNVVEGEAQAWASKMAKVLLNGSLILPLTFTIHGRDVHFFVKQSAQQAKSDLIELKLQTNVMLQYETGINVSVHQSRHSYHSHEEVHVRIHGNHTVIHVRYGTTLEREMRRVLKHAKDRAIEHAWSREKYLLQNGLLSRNHWSDKEMEQIREIGRVQGYVADYIHQPDEFPELADDCNNIQFVPEKP